MTDLPGYAFTRCQSAEAAHTAAKTIGRRPGGGVDTRDYDSTTFWYFQPVTRATHAAMATTLRTLAGRVWDMIVMGAPAPGLDLKRQQFRRWARPEAHENTLVATPRAWLPVDCDDVAVPEGLGAGHRLREAAEHIRDALLPPEFAGIECVAAATSSSGRKGVSVARLRLFFLLDRLHSLAELRSWGRAAKVAGLPVDPAVLQAGQPIYTARPRFEGIDDPVPERDRAFVLPGVFGDRVCLVPDRYDRQAAVIASKARLAETGCGGDWRKLLAGTLGGETSFFEPLSRGLGVAASSEAAEQDIADFVAALLGERADAGRQSQYGRAWVLRTLRRFRRADAGRRGRIDQLKRELFTEEAQWQR